MSISSKRFGTNHISGKQFATLDYQNRRLTVRGYNVVEIDEIKDAGIEGINQVVVKLKNPVDRNNQPVVTETHLVTDKFISSLHNVQYMN